MLLFIFKFSRNSILTISMSDVFYLVFLLKVEITNVANTFQDVVNILHLATCCTSTKVQPCLKLFHLPHHLFLVFHPDWPRKHLCNFSLLSPLWTLNRYSYWQVLPLRASICASIYGIISYPSSLTVMPNKVSYSIFIFESWDLTTVRQNRWFLSA